MDEAYRLLGRVEFLRMRARAINKLHETVKEARAKERYRSESDKVYIELNDAIKFDFDTEWNLKQQEWQQLEEDAGEVLDYPLNFKQHAKVQVVSNVDDSISALYIIQTFANQGFSVKWIHSSKFKTKDLSPPDIKFTIIIGGPKSPGISEVAQKFFKSNKKDFLELYSASGMVAKVLRIIEGKTHCYMVGGPSKINTLKAAYQFANDPEVITLIKNFS